VAAVGFTIEDKYFRAWVWFPRFDTDISRLWRRIDLL